MSMICYNCNQKAEHFISYIFNSNNYCESCWEERITSCYSCTLPLLQNDANIDPSDNVICESCWSDKCGYCGSCETLKWQTDLREVQNKSYCYDCLWEHAFECYSCGELRPLEEEYYCENCDHTYCNSSEDESCREDNYQEQQLNFQDGIKTSIITVDRYIGVELEAENGIRSEIYLPDSFGIKGDGSLDDETGVEIVTPPSKNGALVQNIRLACEQLNSARFEATSACGLHVHIDLRDIQNNFVKLSRILRTFFAVEDVIFAMLPNSRLESSFCNPLRKTYNFYDFYGRKVAKEFDCNVYAEKNKALVNNFKRDHFHSKRYTAFNFHSTFFRGTLEIRAHSGSQNPIKILKWIELLLKITDWSINHYKHSQVEDLLKLNATEKKVRRMRKIFKFSKKIEDYINNRIKEFKHDGLKIAYNLGELPKRKKI